MLNASIPVAFIVKQGLHKYMHFPNEPVSSYYNGKRTPLFIGSPAPVNPVLVEKELSEKEYYSDKNNCPRNICPL